MKEYKCVPGPKQLSAQKNGSEEAIASFASIINHETSGGWAYHSMETITVVEKAGCIFGQSTPITYYMLIFVREV